jgi:hypothetical protein
MGLVAQGAEPAGPQQARFQFRTNDVIAFVGGEDVVEMQRNGYLELLLTAALPHHKLRFRNLAFEGDTVFEQHRQLNFPSWEKQLERVGATVVIAQFGQAESLAGTNALPRFVAEYERLVDRFTRSQRRLLLVGPTTFEKLPSQSIGDFLERNRTLDQYIVATSEVAKRSNVSAVLWELIPPRDFDVSHTRDGLHLNSLGHWAVAWRVVTTLKITAGEQSADSHLQGGVVDAHLQGSNVGPEELERLRQLILEKNRLWFDYWRPQNWAFLHGDRTEQASSRDHRDPKKRWFPEEMEKFLTLIEAKEKEIWKVAAKLATGE